MEAIDLLTKLTLRVPQTVEVPSTEGLKVKVPSSSWAEAASFLKEEGGYDFLNCLTAVDYVKENRFELVAVFQKTAAPADTVTVKCDLPRAENPAAPTLSTLYPGADWQEREVYDLYGIGFTGHPHLRRILLWEGYAGYPLRKDYAHVPDKYDNGQEIGLPTPSAPAAGGKP